MKSRLMGVGGGRQRRCGIRSSVKWEVSTSSVVIVDGNDIFPSRKPILMELYQAPRPQRRLPLLLKIGESRKSIYLMRGLEAP